MSSEHHENRRRKLAELQKNQRRDRARLISMAILLVAVIAIFLQLGSAGGEDPGSVEQGPAPPTSSTWMPQGDPEIMATVRDTLPTERILLEPEPMRHLARQAIALQAAHFREVADPGFPFARETKDTASLRGKPYLFRGEVLHFQSLRRGPDLPEESWYHLRDQDGHAVHFVATSPPETLFNSENFVRADGFFLKTYTRTVDGTAVTAPLFVGRQVLPSVRAQSPAKSVDPILLASVRDHEHYDDEDVDQTGLWHLLSHAQWLAQDTARMEMAFQNAPELDFDRLRNLAAEPEAWRGVPMRIPGRVPDQAKWRNSKPAGENILRTPWVHWGYLGNLAFADHLVLLAGAGNQDFSGNQSLWYLGFFLQLKSYVDQEDNARRIPVFVIAGAESGQGAESGLMNQMIFTFLGLVLLVACVVLWIARRDRHSALAAKEEAAQRKSRRTTYPPASP